MRLQPARSGLEAKLASPMVFHRDRGQEIRTVSDAMTRGRVARQRVEQGWEPPRPQGLPGKVLLKIAADLQDPDQAMGSPPA